jgi:hypothetical protein
MLMARKNHFGKKTDFAYLSSRHVQHRAHDSADGARTEQPPVLSPGTVTPSKGVQSGGSIQGENLDYKTEGHGMAGPRTHIEVPQELERIRHSEAVPDCVKASH